MNSTKEDKPFPKNRREVLFEKNLNTKVSHHLENGKAIDWELK